MTRFDSRGEGQKLESREPHFLAMTLSAVILLAVVTLWITPVDRFDLGLPAEWLLLGAWGLTVVLLLLTVAPSYRLERGTEGTISWESRFFGFTTESKTLSPEGIEAVTYGSSALDGLVELYRLFRVVPVRLVLTGGEHLELGSALGATAGRVLAERAGKIVGCPVKERARTAADGGEVETDPVPDWVVSEGERRTIHLREVAETSRLNLVMHLTVVLPCLAILGGLVALGVEVTEHEWLIIAAFLPSTLLLYAVLMRRDTIEIGPTMLTVRLRYRPLRTVTLPRDQVRVELVHGGVLDDGPVLELRAQGRTVRVGAGVKPERLLWIEEWLNERL